MKNAKPERLAKQKKKPMGWYIQATGDQMGNWTQVCRWVWSSGNAKRQGHTSKSGRSCSGDFAFELTLNMFAIYIEIQTTINAKQ